MIPVYQLIRNWALDPYPPWYQPRRFSLKPETDGSAKDMQLRSNPDLMHGDFEMFSRVLRSIESLFLTSGLRKNYAKEVGIRSVPQYQMNPNFLFWGLFRAGRNRKKWTITLKYATDAERMFVRGETWPPRPCSLRKACSQDMRSRDRNIEL